MTRWLPIVAAILVPGGSILALAIYLRRRWLAQQADALVLLPPVQLFTGHDDSLRLAAEHRRSIASERRRQAQQIESGKPLDSKIRIVSGR